MVYKKHAKLIIVLLFLLAIFSIYQFRNPAASISHQESLYQRVLRTGVIRCGYAAWPPGFIVDPNTKELGGFDYDVMMQVGKLLDLKIEWVRDVGWSNYHLEQKNNSIDVMCAAPWYHGLKTKATDFSTPFAYQPIYAFVRANDSRFDRDYAAANDPSVIVLGQDGTEPMSILHADFPKAKHYVLPGNVDSFDYFVNVANGKADMSFADKGSFDVYNKSNPGKLKLVPLPPIRVWGLSFAFKTGEYEFNRLIDGAVEDLIASGQIDGMIAKYQASDSFWPPARRYIAPAK